MYLDYRKDEDANSPLKYFLGFGANPMERLATTPFENRLRQHHRDFAFSAMAIQEQSANQSVDNMHIPRWRN